MTKIEQKHIDTVGLKRFDEAAARAMLRLKNDGKLRAAIKLRESLAYAMALKATGFPVHSFSLASKANEKRFGAPSHEIQALCDEYLNSTEVEETAT